MFKQPFKTLAGKINFLLGRNPKVDRIVNYKNFIPGPFKTVMTITADFELAWAWHYANAFPNPLQTALDKAKLERENIPIILNLCEKYDIPVTWATVGHLFLDSCQKFSGIPHPEIQRMAKHESKFWKFTGEDWFENDPCSDYKQAPEWYCPDLIRAILQSPVKHEIGCHTFSHIDSSDRNCPPEVFSDELDACIQAASPFGIDFTSFVHPGHQIGNLKILSEKGFTSFQTDKGNILGYPQKHENVLWELIRTTEFAWREDWSVDYHIYRYKKIIDRAIKSKTVCNFWFHPSFDKRFLEKVLPSVLEYLTEKKDIIKVTTVGDYVHWLKENND